MGITLVPLALFNGSYLGNTPTGIGVVARDLVRELDPQKVPLLDPLGGSRKGSIPIPANLMPELGLRGHMRRLLWTQTKLPLILRRAGSPILLSPLPEAPLLREVRSVVIAHDLLPLRYPRLTPLLPYHLSYVPFVMHTAKKILCNSEATAREVHGRLKIPIRKLITIPIGFDQGKLRYLNLIRSNFFLVLGRHNPHKNLQTALQALSKIRRKDLEIWFVGPNDRRYTPKLRKMADELGISGQCRWIPWVDDQERLRLLNTCQALLIISLWEGFGLPALEAMACKTPVIASKAGALPEVVGKAGLLVNPRDPEEVASAMLEVINDLNLRRNIIDNGTEKVREHKWSNSARIVERVLEELQ